MVERTTSASIAAGRDEQPDTGIAASMITT
jgi:hypothetical protein